MVEMHGILDHHLFSRDSRRALWAGVVALGILLALLCPAPTVSAQEPEGRPPKSDPYPNLGPLLTQLAEQARGAGGERKLVSLSIYVQRPDQLADLVAWVESRGGKAGTLFPGGAGEVFGGGLTATLPVSRLGELSRQPGVAYARQRIPPRHFQGDLPLTGACGGFSGRRAVSNFQVGLVRGPGFGQQPDLGPEEALEHRPPEPDHALMEHADDAGFPAPRAAASGSRRAGRLSQVAGVMPRPWSSSTPASGARRPLGADLPPQLGAGDAPVAERDDAHLFGNRRSWGLRQFLGGFGPGAPPGGVMDAPSRGDGATLVEDADGDGGGPVALGRGFHGQGHALADPRRRTGRLWLRWVR